MLVAGFIFYTEGHKKRATLFSTITLTFVDRFIHFLHRWKEEETRYKFTYLATR